MINNGTKKTENEIDYKIESLQKECKRVREIVELNPSSLIAFSRLQSLTDKLVTLRRKKQLLRSTGKTNGFSSGFELIY